MSRDDAHAREHLRKARDASRVASELADRAARLAASPSGSAADAVRGASIRAAEASFALDDAYQGRQSEAHALGVALQALQDATAAVRRAQEALAKGGNVA